GDDDAVPVGEALRLGAVGLLQYRPLDHAEFTPRYRGARFRGEESMLLETCQGQFERLAEGDRPRNGFRRARARRRSCKGLESGSGGDRGNLVTIQDRSRLQGEDSAEFFRIALPVCFLQAGDRLLDQTHRTTT